MIALTGEKTQIITCGDENSCSDGKEAQICPEIARSLNNKVVDRTIQRTLKKEGFFYGKIVKVERLT